MKFYSNDKRELLRPTYMQVDLSVLANNFLKLKQLAPSSKFMAVVKANGYGHGLVPSARLVESLGADSIGVAFVEEGVELRRASIECPILVFGGILGAQIKMFLEHKLDLTVSSEEILQEVDRVAGSVGVCARIHLKIDTGMERIGVRSDRASKLFEMALAAKNCQIIGVFSHLVRAEEPGCDFTSIQLGKFLESVEFFNRVGAPMPIRHLANSAGLLRYPETYLDMVRPGICLYGVYPDESLADLQALEPVMTLKSKVAYFKVVPAGSGVSYGHKWTAKEDTRVITVPVGYGDGYFRSLSNIGSVLVGGKRAPIIGAVCMDQLMADIGPCGEAFVGDEVVLIGSQGDDRITVNEIAEAIGTIPYEVLTCLNLRVPRLYVNSED